MDYFSSSETHCWHSSCNIIYTKERSVVMIGILLVTHEEFGEAALKTAELILGKQEEAFALGCHRGDSIEEFCENVKSSIEKLDTGKGVLVFADLYGASPYNIAAKASNTSNSKFRCITGFSLPMVIEAFSMRETCELEELTDKCMETGLLGIKELFKEIEIFDANNK
jgi:PTS system mannose-specific IIA component